MDSNSAILIARPIRKGGMTITIFTVTCDKLSRNGKQVKARKVNLYRVKEMLTLPVWLVDLHVSVDECGGPDTFRMRPPDSLLLNVLRLRSTMTLVVSMLNDPTPAELKNYNSRVSSGRKPEYAWLQRESSPMSFLYNDIIEWITLFCQYFSVLSLKQWVLEVFLNGKCVVWLGH